MRRIDYDAFGIVLSTISVVEVYRFLAFPELDTFEFKKNYSNAILMSFYLCMKMK